MSAKNEGGGSPYSRTARKPETSSSPTENTWYAGYYSKEKILTLGLVAIFKARFPAVLVVFDYLAYMKILNYRNKGLCSQINLVLAGINRDRFVAYEENRRHK